MRVKAWNNGVLVADYTFAESIDAFVFAAGMRAKNYNIEMEKLNV